MSQLIYMAGVIVDEMEEGYYIYLEYLDDGDLENAQICAEILNDAAQYVYDMWDIVMDEYAAGRISAENDELMHDYANSAERIRQLILM